VPKAADQPLKLPREWTPPRLLKWQEEALREGWFDFAVPRFEWIVTSQAALALGLSVTSTQALCDNGKLETRLKCITGKRNEQQISRRSLLLYLASTTQMDPKDFCNRCVDFVRAIGNRQILTVMQEAIAQELRK
jgi:hypothetical protein